MAVPVVFAALGKPPGFLRNLGFLGGSSGTPLAWLLAAAVAIAAIWHAQRIPSVRRWLFRVSWLKLLSVVVALVAATVEEAFFRRVIMDYLQRRGAEAWFQVFASALCFGIPHAWFGLLRPNWPVIRGAVAATTVMGAGLALVYVVGGRSLAPCIVPHFLITAALEPGLVLAGLGGLRGRPAEAAAARTAEGGK